MAGFLKLSVQFIANIFPNSKTVRLNNHCSTYFFLINKLCLFDNVCIPLSNNVFHCRNFFYILFRFTNATHLLYMFYFELFSLIETQKTLHPKKGQRSGGTTLVYSETTTVHFI